MDEGEDFVLMMWSMFVCLHQKKEPGTMHIGTKAPHNCAMLIYSTTQKITRKSRPTVLISDNLNSKLQVPGGIGVIGSLPGIGSG